MRVRNYGYIVLMGFFMVLAYLFFDRGFNVKTKEMVRYQENSDIKYKVYLQKNNEFDDEYLKMGGRYISKLVDNINFEFNYNSLFNKNVNGYYTYYVVGTLHAYLDDINESIWEKDYIILDNKTEVINKNNIKNIDILDRFSVDYDKYKSELDNFSKKYGLDLYGYLDISVIIKENLNFTGIKKIVEDEKKMEITIPLSYDTFKLSIKNDNNKIDSYANYNNRTKVNYFLIIVAAFLMAIGISFMALVIRSMVGIVSGNNNYRSELRKILRENDDIIVKIKRFYNKKKYNLIYVDSFKELLDVYSKVGNPISYREVKKDEEAIFILIEDNNAWIYQLKK